MESVSLKTHSSEHSCSMDTAFCIKEVCTYSKVDVNIKLIEGSRKSLLSFHQRAPFSPTFVADKNDLCPFESKPTSVQTPL